MRHTCALRVQVELVPGENQHCRTETVHSRRAGAHEPRETTQQVGLADATVTDEDHLKEEVVLQQRSANGGQSVWGHAAQTMSQ